MLSADGRCRVRALPDAVVVEDTTGATPPRQHPSTPLEGGAPSRVSELHVLPLRRSVLVAFATLPELWEIACDPQAPPIFNGLVHDYKMGEAIAQGGFLNPRRTRLPEPLAGLAFGATQAWVLGRAGPAPDGAWRLRVVNLDIRLPTAEHRLPGRPDTAAARPGHQQGRAGLWVPDTAGGIERFIGVGVP